MMKITGLPVYGWGVMIALKVFSRDVSPVESKAATCEKSQTSPVALRPCMSWHWSGVIHT
jgi:hypothetical protein